MTQDEKASEIYRCAVAGLAPLMDGNAEYAVMLLKLQQRRLNAQAASKVIGEVAELAHVGREAALAHQAEMDTTDESLQMLGFRTLGSPDVNVMNELTQATAAGFCEAINLMLAQGGTMDRCRQSEIECDSRNREIRSFIPKSHPDLRDTIEKTAKWLDAAVLIAKAEQPLTAEAAFAQACRAR